MQAVAEEEERGDEINVRWRSNKALLYSLLDLGFVIFLGDSHPLNWLQLDVQFKHHYFMKAATQLRSVKICSEILRFRLSLQRQSCKPL